MATILAVDIFKWIFLNKNGTIPIQISLKFVQLTVNQHWLRKWLGAEQATIHCLNEWWSSSPTHICGTGGKWLSGSAHYNDVITGDSVSNHKPHDCLLNRVFRRRSKKTSKLRVTGLCSEIHRGPVNSPHKWSVTREMYPSNDVIMFHDIFKLIFFYNKIHRDRSERSN